MIVHPFPQGSTAWRVARCGKITASAVERYFSPTKKTLSKNRAGNGPSQGAMTYVYELLAEWRFGVPASAGSTQFMQRGTVLEQRARAAYELHTMTDVQECGFIEYGMFGCSVDGLVGDDGILEIKVLGGREHLRAFHEDGGDRAVAQAQAQMLDTGRMWVDRFFWHPDPSLWIDPIRTDRDDEYIDALDEARTVLAIALEDLQVRHTEAGFVPTPFDPAQWDANGERVFSEDESSARIAELERKRARSNGPGTITQLDVEGGTVNYTRPA